MGVYRQSKVRLFPPYLVDRLSNRNLHDVQSSENILIKTQCRKYNRFLKFASLKLADLTIGGFLMGILMTIYIWSLSEKL
ncbi:hypothetical protein T05_12398 [Trichinella murrelli]|uniref:Uncharacterized protein n=1 Tax=Trichinella murrelli TaxID=144512 RepID=A0A0V0THH2_9BILA|nr:hypothetical protein T05_12398 [Trichinella murrelli]